MSKSYLSWTGTKVELPNSIRLVTAALVVDECGRVLLEKRSDNGFWGLPGGAVEVGESVLECVVREVFEETGLVVSVTRFTGIYSSPDLYTISTYPDGNSYQNVALVFLCEKKSGSLIKSGESEELKYFTINDLPADILYSHRVRIKEAFDGHEGVLIR